MTRSRNRKLQLAGQPGPEELCFGLLTGSVKEASSQTRTLENDTEFGFSILPNIFMHLVASEYKSSVWTPVTIFQAQSALSIQEVTLCAAYTMTVFRSLAAALLLANFAHAGDDDWVSPVYKDIFKYPLPIPPTKPPKTSYTNATTGQTIDYYEVEVKPFSQSVYRNLKPANLVGYDGMSPGPTFMMEKGREAVVRFINKATKPISVHLHGSYSE